MSVNPTDKGLLTPENCAVIFIDFRKNLLNIRKTVKDVSQNPVSLLRQHAGQPDCAA
jgi:hypothetical protein